MKNDIAIKLTNISKRYYLHPDKPTLVENLNPFKKSQEFWALKDINITIKKGERIGIIGPNGSGKTTLLKIIAGITKPTTGTIETYGKIVSLIELTAGFHPEMNGVDNIFINGMLLGMSKTEIKSKISKIISFADIGKYINQPLYTFSDGMRLRLGYSISIFSNPQIILLDETFSAGDSQFREKMEVEEKRMIKKKITMVMVSHWYEYIQKHTNSLISLSHGTT